VTLWQIDIYPADGQPDALGSSAASAAADMGIAKDLTIHGAYGFLLGGPLSESETKRIGQQLLSDPIAQKCRVAKVGDASLSAPPDSKLSPALVYALPKPGVMDPVAQSTHKLLNDIGLKVEQVRTFRKYWIASNSNGGVDKHILDRMCQKVLANDSIEQVNVGPLVLNDLGVGSHYEFQKVIVPLLQLSDDELMKLSKVGQLYLSLAEMQTVQKHFKELGREPTDIELESIAQTWSEHCSHKTLGGKDRIHG
jgi:phosphoribosylformylglycinamidine synthase subunit PurSL